MPYLKFGITKAWESTEIENAIHFEWHTFHIIRILARSVHVVFISARLNIENPVTLVIFLRRDSEKFHTLHNTNSTLEFLMNCQLKLLQKTANYSTFTLRRPVYKNSSAEF